MYHKGIGGDPDLLAALFCDKDRRCFISSCSNLRAAEPIVRQRWRQVTDVSTQQEPEHLTLTIDQPQVAKEYYDCCSKIDQHNRKRQDDLDLEKKIGTHDWSKRVNLSILGIVTVDAYLSYIECTQPTLEQEKRESFNEFICKLADELIEMVYVRKRGGKKATQRHIIEKALEEYFAKY